MGWLFTFILFLHLLGALLLVAAMGLQTTLAFLIRRVGDPGELRRLLAVSHWAPRLFAPATGLLLASGTAMAVWSGVAGARWGWMAVAFVAVIGLQMWGKSAGRRRGKRLARLAAESGEALSLELRGALGDSSTVTHLALEASAITGLIVLMVYRPGTALAIAVMLAALLATLAVHVLVRKQAAKRWHAAGPSRASDSLAGH